MHENIPMCSSSRLSIIFLYVIISTTTTTESFLRVCCRRWWRKTHFTSSSTHDGSIANAGFIKMIFFFRHSFLVGVVELVDVFLVFFTRTNECAWQWIWAFWYLKLLYFFYLICIYAAWMYLERVEYKKRGEILGKRPESSLEIVFVFCSQA